MLDLISFTQIHHRDALPLKMISGMHDIGTRHPQHVDKSYSIVTALNWHLFCIDPFRSHTTEIYGNSVWCLYHVLSVDKSHSIANALEFMPILHQPISKLYHWNSWHTMWYWYQGRFINANKLLNLRAHKISTLHNNCIFQCMGKIFCVEFQRYPLKFHTKYLTHTLKDVYFIHMCKI